LLAFIANSIEYFHYPNFLYSHIRFSPLQINALFGICVSVIVLIHRRSVRLSPSGLVIALLVVYQISSRVPDAIGMIIGKSARVATRLQYSELDKMKLVWGESVGFFNFLTREIPEASSVLLPPETLPWRYTGSTQFLGPWLYPRKVRTALEPYYRLRFDEFDFIVISSEEDGANVSVWPDFPVEAEQIKVYGWGVTNQTITGKDWNPDQWRDKKPWGLITVKKNHDE